MLCYCVIYYWAGVAVFMKLSNFYILFIGQEVFAGFMKSLQVQENGDNLQDKVRIIIWGASCSFGRDRGVVVGMGCGRCQEERG